jgi:hypothetical protein
MARSEGLISDVALSFDPLDQIRERTNCVAIGFCRVDIPDTWNFIVSFLPPQRDKRKSDLVAFQTLFSRCERHLPGSRRRFSVSNIDLDLRPHL